MITKDNPQVFHSGQQITLTMNLSKEQYAALVEWSNSIPTLYFLDICVVNVLKLNGDALEKNPRKSRIANHLRKLDKPQNCFSYLLALMEKVSDSRGKLTDDELKKQIIHDVSAMRNFFKNACIYEPDDFVVSFLQELRGTAIEANRSNYLVFLETVNNQYSLREPISPKYRIEKARQIINEADRLKISRHHPVVVITIACLYGNTAAKKVIKFKTASNFQPENSLADIMAISRFHQLKLQIEFYGQQGKGRFLRSDFITDDDGLGEIIRYFKPKYVKYNARADDREIELSFDINLKELLTEINEDEYEKILELFNHEP